jgi:hypothetical protein
MIYWKLHVMLSFECASAQTCRLILMHDGLPLFFYSNGMPAVKRKS